MVKVLCSVLLVLLIVGCGGSSDESTPSTNTSSPSVPQDSNETTSISTDEPYFTQQWSLAKDNAFYSLNGIDSDANIHAGTLLDSYTGSGVKIAVIDNGLDASHEDLVGAIVAAYDAVTGTTNVSQSTQTANHGTAVTGIVAARANGKGIKGVASGADIIFIKYKEYMSDSDTIALFDKAASLGASIISNSWGTGDVSPAVKAKIVDLATNGRNGKGIVIVFASGNDDQDMGNDESSIPEVISVGSTNKDNLRASYSNYGSNLDIVAPGGEYRGITTLDPMGSKGSASIVANYLLYNDSNAFVGTSAATPLVSGIVALMLEKNPNLTRVEIENILKNSADKIGIVPYDFSGRNDYYGYGKVNLTNIMKLF